MWKDQAYKFLVYSQDSKSDSLDIHTVKPRVVDIQIYLDKFKIDIEEDEPRMD